VTYRAPGRPILSTAGGEWKGRLLRPDLPGRLRGAVGAAQTDVLQQVQGPLLDEGRVGAGEPDYEGHVQALGILEHAAEEGLLVLFRALVDALAARSRGVTHGGDGDGAVAVATEPVIVVRRDIAGSGEDEAGVSRDGQHVDLGLEAQHQVPAGEGLVNSSGYMPYTIMGYEAG